MTGKDFLSFAKMFCGHDNETERRTAVSRAYYGLFHQAKSIVVSAGITVPNDASAHVKLSRYLKETGKNGISDASYVGKKLEELRTVRNNADYDLEDKTFNKNTCVFQYALAESSCRKLESINGSDLKKGLVAYAKSVNEL